MRKAMLFTVAFVILSLITFMIALLVFHSYQNTEIRFYEIGSMDRMYDLSSSIEQGLLEVFEVSSGMNVVVNESSSTMIIAEELPSSSAQNFKDDMADFQSFVESNFQEVKLNLFDVSGDLPLIIYPYNVTYTHPDQYGQDRINIIPQELNFNSYEIYVYSEFDNVTGIDWGGPKSGDKYMSVTAEDSYGNYFFEESNKIDFTKNQLINILLESSGGNILIQLDPNEDGKLRLESHSSVPVSINISIDFDPMEEPISISFPDDTINVTYTNLDISRIHTVKIA